MSPYRIESTPTADTFPMLTRDQVREVDRLAIEELGIPGIVLMENASFNATAALLDYVHQQRGLTPADIQAAILCGGGNNGGDGYAIARHLHNRGVSVTLFALKEPTELSGDAAINHQICANMGLPIELVLTATDVPSASAEWSETDVIVDALLGTGFQGEVREPTAAMIESVNALRAESDLTVMAVDVPSGLNGEEQEAARRPGASGEAIVRADLTVTFVAAKKVFFMEEARPYVGALAVADIGAPPELVERAREAI